MIININKPKHWTSFDVVAKMKGVLKVKKIGHAGTLDPLAEGVLILLTNDDTSMQERIMKTEKEYVADIVFGASTPTDDLEFDPEIHAKQLSLDKVKEKLPEIFKKYSGEISQIPPDYSAVKVDGKALYKYARANKSDTVSKPVKTVTIHSYEILDLYTFSIVIKDVEYKFPAVKLKIVCSSGTYVRSLARDFGTELGSSGFLGGLTRTRVGNYKIEDSYNLQEVIADPNKIILRR